MNSEKIGIIGSGVIGRAWCMLFSSVGYRTVLYDNSPTQLDDALGHIRKELRRLEQCGRLRGPLGAAEQVACISTTNRIEELVRDATHIQECIPERIDWKRSLYEQLDGLVEEQTIIASSTSTFMPSLFSADLQHKAKMLVAHPLNPPYFIPLVEIVPAPWTSADAVARTRALMLRIGQKPVTLRREIPGFVANRLQYAILNEVWHLVENGIVGVADVDSVMTNGLGLRYAFVGPLETAHLNAAGIGDYIERFGSEIFSVSQTFEGVPRMQTGATLERICQECEQMVAIDNLNERRAERDEFLAKLNELKGNL